MDATMSISGWVGGDIIFRQNRTANASFRIASTPRMWKPGGWVDGTTTWFTVMCFRTLAENVKASVSKGDAVFVIGKLRTSKWVNDDGELQDKLVLEAQIVGHDLTRGTTAFHKTERVFASDDSADETNEMLTELERQTAETVIGLAEAAPVTSPTGEMSEVAEVAPVRAGRKVS